MIDRFMFYALPKNCCRDQECKLIVKQEVPISVQLLFPYKPQIP